MIVILICTILFSLYTLLILYYWISWKSVPEFTGSSSNNNLSVSIVIPARNEEKRIPFLLEALTKQSYPAHLTEIIVVNDHSTDNTSEEVSKFQGIKLISLREEDINSYKKKAIETGIAAAVGNLIITTDADCVPAPKWIETIVAFKEKNNAAFIAGPVVFENNSSVIEIFQALDFLVLQGITAASVYKGFHSMCNGANIAYEKKAFVEVNGFSGIDNIASGDDMLLMNKMSKKFPGRVFYLKSTKAIVATKPMQNLKSFLNQRIRWASKARYYNDKRIFAVLLLVYLFNLSFLALAIVSFFHLYFLYVLVSLWILKTLVEIPFVYSVSQFFKKQSLIKYFFFFQPLHVLYTIIAGWLGQFGKYEWKGRRVR